jgi:prepilin-type N-terminal cleavage/methylation domain-containing protein
MNYEHKKGFSLMEVLLSIGILSIGMIFIAGVFPVAIYLTTVSTERTIAAVAADEAFAKIKLYVRPNANILADRQRWLQWMPIPDPWGLTDPNINPNEFFYPSTNESSTYKQYYWSALLRRVGPTDIQTTVFVSRKTGGSDVLALTEVGVNNVPARPDEISIVNSTAKTLINDGYTVVENSTGQIYRVLERYSPPNDNVLKLDRIWQGGNSVWVVPPPVGGGRYPCIAVYQKVIRF